MTDEDNFVRIQIEASAKLAEEAQERLRGKIEPISDAVRGLLASRIGEFSANATSIVGSDGTVIGPFGVVVHLGLWDASAPVLVNHVAAVVITCENLTVECLQQAYAAAKQIKDLPGGATPEAGIAEPTSIAMKIVAVFARSSAMALDQISDEMAQLNAGQSCENWPDLVAVSGIGFVNYATRLPGEQKYGDFLLPAMGHKPSAAPPLYISKMMCGAGGQTFNKLASLVCTRVSIFRPGMQVGKYDMGLMGLYGITTGAYQFDLSGRLHPTTPHDQIADLLPTNLFEIIVDKEVLGSVQFRKWQDGGAFIVRGRFPLEIFLIFLRQQVPSLNPNDMRFIRRKDFQISYVLPINEGDFRRTLALFQSTSSNMAILPAHGKLLMEKLVDEGTTSPFYARLMLGVFQVRDFVFDDEARKPFERAYESVIDTLTTARDCARSVTETWSSHRDKVASGEIVRVVGNNVEIGQSINRELKRDFEGFVNASARTLKGMERVAQQLGADIGFLFKKPSAFKSGLDQLRVADARLADYLESTRGWSEPLIKIRNDDLEHGAGSQLKVRYNLEAKVTAQEPQINGETLTAFIGRMLNRLNCFVEEVTIHHLQKRMPTGCALTESAVAARTGESPERFRLTPATGGLEPWTLKVHDRQFEDV